MEHSAKCAGAVPMPGRNTPPEPPAAVFHNIPSHRIPGHETLGPVPS